MSSLEGPALYRHCKTIYASMRENADFGQGNTVYEGRLTELFRACDLATPNYTHVMRELKAMGCVRQLARGGGGAPSQWLLIQEPTIELWSSEKKYTNGRPPSRLEQLEQQMADMRKRLQELGGLA